MRVLITGGGGFVARHAAAEFVKNGHRVVVASHSPKAMGYGRGCKVLRGGFTAAVFCRKDGAFRQAGAVLHLAGHSRSHGNAPIADIFEGERRYHPGIVPRAIERFLPHGFSLEKASTAYVYALLV